MPKPKKGDVLRWKSCIIKVTSEPVRSHEYPLEAMGCCIVPEHQGRCPVAEIVVFQKEDVEESGWEYVEDSFVLYVKEVRHQAGLDE